MVGRRNPQDEGHTLAIRTDFKGKGVAHDDGRGRLIGGGSNGVDAGARAHNERFTTRSPTASLSSISTLGDDQVNTHLSASSAGNTDTLSSSGISGRSTARTSTMTDDDRPSASTPASPSPHAHPTLTVLQLVSNSASSSALPDSFDFNVSRKGNFAAVFSASNIWLIKTAQLPRLWARTLQVKRKPIAIDITEDGFLLAVLSRPTQVDIYEIHGEQDEQIKKRRSIGLVHEATTTVISPDARILITGNKFGIEVIAIGPDAPETARRALSGPVGDSLEFADDGRTLLITGCARKSESSSLYVLPGLYDGPMDEEGVPIPVAPETIWTTSVLFPETARIARQATLLPDADTGHVSELFAFNAEEDTWGIYDIACQRFTQRKMFLPDHQRWTRSEFIDDAMPAVSPNADLAAVALRMRGTTSIWIYEVPGWECKPSEKQSPIQPCFCIPILKDGADVSQEISALRWVRINSKVQRLVAVGNATMSADDNADPGAPVGSKGVIIVLDFDKSKPAGSPVSPPTKTEYDLDPLCPGEILPEGNISFESEVELVRTRTIAQRRIQDRAAGARRNSRLGSQPARSRTSANSSNRHPPRPAPPPAPADDEEELTFEEAQAAFEAPYDNQQPRSQMSLARAATVAAVSPANRRHLRALPFRPLEYRRADGLREFPHESDADNWVPPPPVYTATAEASQSISLSHPNAPPVPRKPSNGGRSVSASHTSPPVPLTSATVSPTQIVSTNPYLARGQSASSTDLTHPQPHERRPSLLHPSTYPAPQSPPTTRRRSSTAHGPPQQVPTIAPNTQIQNQSAYQATQSLISTARRPLRPRRGVESTVDLRPPPLVDPGTLRRGSEPEVLSHGHGRSQSAQSANVGTNRNRLLNGLSTSGHAQRSTLPRLVTQGDATTRRGPMTAPPRSDTIGRGPPPRAESRAESRLGMGSRLGMRSGVRESYNERREKDHGKKPMKCIVM